MLLVFFALAPNNGVFMLNKKGKKVNKIRHIRCWASVSEPLSIKQQTYLSKHEYKNYYWAANGENIICAFYKNDIIDKKGNLKKDREIEIVNLNNAAKLKSFGLVENNELEIYRSDKNGKIIIKEDGTKEKPYALLMVGMKVIFFDKNIDDIKWQTENSEKEYIKRLSDRTYKIVKFGGSQVTFLHHLDARDEKLHLAEFPENEIFKIDKDGKEITFGKRGKNGFTEKILDNIIYNEGKPWHKLLYTKDWFDFAIEGKDFKVNMDGTIQWKNKL